MIPGRGFVPRLGMPLAPAFAPAAADAAKLRGRSAAARSTRISSLITEGATQYGGTLLSKLALVGGGGGGLIYTGTNIFIPFFHNYTSNRKHR